MTHQQALEKKIQDKTAVIGILGLGYVGLPLAVAFGEDQHRLAAGFVAALESGVHAAGRTHVCA